MKMFPFIITALVSLLLLAAVSAVFIIFSFWKLDRNRYPKTYAHQLKITKIAIISVIIVWIVAMALLFITH